MTKLYKHQSQTLQFASQVGSYADLSDCGTGKTIATLAVINHLYETVPTKVLVIAPKSIILSGWVSDCHNAFPQLRIQPVIGTRKQKLNAFNLPADIYVTNYETMNLPFDFFEEEYTILVCDEAVRLKNPRARWTKTIINLSKHIPVRIIISGLITPNNMMEIYAPMNIVAPGQLGKNFWQFRGRYFTPDPFSYQSRTWVPKKGSEEKIAEVISPFIIRHEKSKCLDLPGKIHSVREIEMTRKQASYYKEMKQTAILQLQDATVSAVTKASMIGKLAQISAGFIYDRLKDTHYFDSAKLNELNDLLTGELAAEQVLIFYNFKGEVELFKELYPDAAFITGGQGSASQEAAIKNFKSDKSRLLFASVKAAKYGLTFTNCSYTIYFSMNYSLDDIYQSQERTHRIGQTRTVNYIYLITKNTVDEVIYDTIQKKQTLNDLIIAMIQKGKSNECKPRARKTS